MRLPIGDVTICSVRGASLPPALTVISIVPLSARPIDRLFVEMALFSQTSISTMAAMRPPATIANRMMFLRLRAFLICSGISLSIAVIALSIAMPNT